jgi:hypothetical protein
MEISDQNPSIYHTFKIEVSTDMSGHMLVSPENRHLVQSEGFFAEPHKLKAAEWIEGFSKLANDGVGGKFEKYFINMKEIGNYLSAGTLTFIVKVSMKEVEIVNTMGQRSHGHQKTHNY